MKNPILLSLTLTASIAIAFSIPTYAQDVPDEQVPIDDGGIIIDDPVDYDPIIGQNGIPEEFLTEEDFVSDFLGDLEYEPNIAYAFGDFSNNPDLDALNSLFFSGLPIATASRQAVFATSRAAISDVGGRLFLRRANLLSQPAVNTGTTTVGLSKDGKNTLPVEPPSSSFPRFSVFASGDYGRDELDRIENQAGFDGDTWAGTIGAEFRATENLSIGAAFTYAGSDFEFSESLGDIQIEGPSGSVYLSYATPAFYADLLYNYGAYEVETNRSPLFFQPEYHGETNSDQHQAEFNTGYNLILANGHFLTGPIARLHYAHGTIDSYTESTLGAATLLYDEQNFDSLTSTIGWQTSYKWTLEGVTIVPQIRASWGHEYLDDTDTVGAELVRFPFISTTPAGDGNIRASAETQNPGTDYLQAGAGIVFLIGDRVSVTLDYEGEFFRDDLTSHHASLRAAIRF